MRFKEENRRELARMALRFAQIAQSDAAIVLLGQEDRQSCGLVAESLMHYLHITAEMRKQRQKAGQATGKAKSDAARENGKKGGRPRKNQEEK